MPTLPYTLARLIRAIAEAVTAVEGRTYWDKPYTVAQLRKNPYMDPAMAHTLKLVKPLRDTMFPRYLR